MLLDALVFSPVVPPFESGSRGQDRWSRVPIREFELVPLETKREALAPPQFHSVALPARSAGKFLERGKTYRERRRANVARHARQCRSPQFPRVRKPTQWPHPGRRSHKPNAEPARRSSSQLEQAHARGASNHLCAISSSVVPWFPSHSLPLATLKEFTTWIRRSSLD